jgi:AhpD family alkylhydroperoxidase
MEPRLNVSHAAPAGYNALLALEKSINGSGLDHKLLDLVRLRVSQINGCAFCVDMHSYDLKKAGERDERIWSVAAWREAPCFSDVERAALALAESATRLSDNPSGVPDDVWDAAAKHFGEPELAALVMAIAAINAWNRIGVSTQLVAGSYRKATA